MITNRTYWQLPYVFLIGYQHGRGSVKAFASINDGLKEDPIAIPLGKMVDVRLQLAESFGPNWNTTICEVALAGPEVTYDGTHPTSDYPIGQRYVQNHQLQPAYEEKFGETPVKEFCKLVGEQMGLLLAEQTQHGIGDPMDLLSDETTSTSMESFATTYADPQTPPNGTSHSGEPHRDSRLTSITAIKMPKEGGGLDFEHNGETYFISYAEGTTFLFPMGRELLHFTAEINNEGDFRVVIGANTVPNGKAGRHKDLIDYTTKGTVGIMSQDL